MSGEVRGMSPTDQEKLGEAMAEVFAQARAAAELEQHTESFDAAETN